MTESGMVVLATVPSPTDVARLVVTEVHDGYECTLFRADQHHEVIAAWHATPDAGEDEWLDDAKDRLDTARIVMTDYRADGLNRWIIQGGAFLNLSGVSA